MNRSSFAVDKMLPVCYYAGIRSLCPQDYRTFSHWRSTSMKSMAKTETQPGAGVLLVIGSGVLALTAAALAYLLSVHSKLRHASKPGRAVSATVTPSDNPLTTFNREGKSGDPINLQFVGTMGKLGPHSLLPVGTGLTKSALSPRPASVPTVCSVASIARPR